MIQNNANTTGRSPKKGFQPGKSGNPGGRPKTPEAFKALAKSASLKALKRLIEIFEDEHADDDDIVKAASLVFDRAYGKAAQDINVGGQPGNPVTHSFDTAGMSCEEKILFAGLLAKGLTKHGAEADS